MPIPSTAKSLGEPLDPQEIDDYEIEITQAGASTEDFPILQAGESVASYTLTTTPEAAAAGLRIKTGGGYSTTLTDRVVKFWLEVDSALQADAMFNAGVTLAVELTVLTNNTPPRKRQKTSTIKVVQK